MKKNALKRSNFKHFEKQNLILKLISNNKLIHKKITTKFAILRHRYSKNSSISLVRNNCNYTYRNAGIINQYQISRLQFKTHAADGFIPGIRRY
jgi:ribosomal protein S14